MRHPLPGQSVCCHAPPPTWSVSVLPCATPHLVSQCAAMRHPPPGQSVCWHCSTSTKKPHLLGTSTLPSQRAGIVQPVHQFCHRRHHDEAVLAQLRLHGRALAGGSAQGGTVGVRRGKVVHRVVQGWYRVVQREKVVHRVVQGGTEGVQREKVAGAGTQLKETTWLLRSVHPPLAS